MYLVWLDRDSTRAEAADVMLGRVAPELLDLGPLRLSLDVRDPESDIPAPVPTPDGETPLHGLVSLWLDAVDHRAPYEAVLAPVATRVAGYSVLESLYRDYGANRWSAPRDWPDGARSPGVLTVALLRQHPDLSFDEWMTRWHTRISPITESIQPRMRYVRNAVFRPLTDGRAPIAGHRRGGVAVPRARDRPHAVLLCRRRLGPHGSPRHPDARGDHRLHRPEHAA